MNIRPSACGAYCVALVAAYPQVWTITETMHLRRLYLANATKLTAEGEHALADHERRVATVLESALREAAGFNAATKVMVAEELR